MKKQQKILISTIGIILVLATAIVIAIQLNWFEVGDLGGTIEKNELTITKAQLNLGSIASGSSFSTSDTATLNIPITESDGMNVSKFLLVSPVTLTSRDDYFQERFRSLYLNITINGTTTTMIVVESNVFDPFNDWSYEDSEFSPDFCWDSFKDWENVFLSTGANVITITVYGKAGAPSIDLTIDLSFSFELS